MCFANTVTCKAHATIPDYHLRGIRLQSTSQVKDVGVCFVSKLSF